MKTLIIFPTLILLPFFLLAQPKYEGGLLLGTSTYMGDLANDASIRTGEANLAAGLLLRHHLSPTKAVRANLLYTQFSGNDDNHDVRSKRGYDFETTVLEFSVVGEWEPWGKRRFGEELWEEKSRLSPFLFAGAGATFINPEPSFGDGTPAEKVRLDEEADFSSVQLSIPFGLGLKIGLKEQWMLGLEAGLRPTFTDYLDGVSEAGNPGENDWYFLGGATINYWIGYSK